MAGGGGAGFFFVIRSAREGFAGPFGLVSWGGLGVGEGLAALVGSGLGLSFASGGFTSFFGSGEGVGGGVGSRGGDAGRSVRLGLTGIIESSSSDKTMRPCVRDQLESQFTTQRGGYIQESKLNECILYGSDQRPAHVK